MPVLADEMPVAINLILAVLEGMVLEVVASEELSESVPLVDSKNAALELVWSPKSGVGTASSEGLLG